MFTIYSFSHIEYFVATETKAEKPLALRWGRSKIDDLTIDDEIELVTPEWLVLLNVLGAFTKKEFDEQTCCIDWHVYAGIRDRLASLRAEIEE